MHEGHNLNLTKIEMHGGWVTARSPKWECVVGTSTQYTYGPMYTLFDDLQRAWSDTTFAAERLRLEALDEDGAQTQHEPEVIGVEDRAREGLAEADL